MALNYIALTLDLYDGTENHLVSGTASFTWPAVLLDGIVTAEGAVRSSTLISLATQVPYRILPWSAPLRRAARRSARYDPRGNLVRTRRVLHLVTLDCRSV